MAALTDLVRIAPDIGGLNGDEIKALLMPLNLDRYNIGDAIKASRVSTDALLAELRDASNNSVQIDVGSVLGFDSAPIENLARNAEKLLRQPVQLKDQVKWAVIRAFTRPNALKNQYAALAEHMLDATEQEGAHKIDTVYSDWIESNRFGWNLASIRDPATAIFMGNALLDAAYFRKMFRSMQVKSAQRRLHLLRLEIRRAKIADEQIQRYLDSANPSLFNPHDMKPMRWESTKRMLYAPSVGNSDWRPEVKL